MKTGGILFVCSLFLQAQLNVISARAVGEEEKTPLTPLTDVEKQCVKDLNLNEQHILELNNEDIALENDIEYNKFLECYWKKMKLQNSDGKIDYDALRDLIQSMAADELQDEDEDVVYFVQQIGRRAVTYCQYNPPVGSYSHGQACVQTQNCVMKKLVELVADLEDL